MATLRFSEAAWSFLFFSDLVLVGKVVSRLSVSGAL